MRQSFRKEDAINFEGVSEEDPKAIELPRVIKNEAIHQLSDGCVFRDQIPNVQGELSNISNLTGLNFIRLMSPASQTAC